MGYSITAERGEKLDALRQEGRLCMVDREHLTRATVQVRQRSWTYRIGEGEAHESDMPMCLRHARQFPVGFQGVNFEVIGQERF